MTLQLLPNYFKKIGLSLFLITMLPNFFRGFWEGFQGHPQGYYESILAKYSILGIPLNEQFFSTLGILSVLGLIIYALSKDKVFDEFLLQLRLESIHLSFFVSVLIIFVMLFFEPNSEISALFVVELQVLIFLITNKIKKVRSKPSTAESYE